MTIPPLDASLLYRATDHTTLAFRSTEDLEDVDSAMKTYLAGVHPGAAWGPPINVLTDAASFLWRAELAGNARKPALWQEVKRYGD